MKKNDIVKENSIVSLKEGLVQEEVMRKEHSDLKNCGSETSSSKEICLTVEGMNEATRGPPKVVRGLFTIHLGTKWIDRS